MLENNEETFENKDVKVTEEVNSVLEEQELTENSEEVKAEKDDELEENDEALKEIENSVAENAENRESKQEETPAVDYSEFTLEELVEELKNTIANNPVQKIKTQVDAIKNAFNKKFGALLAEKKAAFLAEGGNSIDFQFSSPIKAEYNTIIV